VQGVNAPLQLVCRDRLREVVILGAVAATEVAAARDDELGVERGVGEEDARNRLEEVLNLH
jgi:hypothetical protein